MADYSYHEDDEMHVSNDPYDLSNSIEIFPVPGASSVSAGISISGFSDKYLFLGFLPEKKSQIVKEVKKLSSFENSIIFFISSKKINKILDPFIDYFSDDVAESIKNSI